MREEKVLFDAVLGFPVREDEVLLAFKTQKIGKDRWNGFGGGIEEGETPIEAMVREFAEESGATADPKDVEKAAVVDFHNRKSDGTEFTCRVHVFLIREWAGEIMGSPEMITPTWFPKEHLPRLMAADIHWLPPVLRGEKILAEASYSPFQESLIGEVKITSVKDFS